ncbi:RNA polymerase sigma factor, partial [Leifsonia sp. NCR5]
FERDRKVRDAFAKLSRQDQDVITLCVLEELTTSQAAQALGVPDGTVKSRLSRARKRLAELASPLADDRPLFEGGAR